MSLIKLQAYSAKGRNFYKALFSADDNDAQEIYFNLKRNDAMSIRIDSFDYSVVSSHFDDSMGFEMIIRRKP
jgi:hypothetical protein